MQQSATPEQATGPDPVGRRPGGGAVTAEPVLPPEPQNENLGHDPMQQSAAPKPATGPDPAGRRPGFTAGAAKRNFRPRLHATVSHTGACHRARPGAVATWFYRRSGKAKFSATTPAFAGAGSHATVSHTGACHRARPGAAATRFYRRSGKAKFSATTPAFAGAGSHATVSHTGACHRARPGGRRPGGGAVTAAPFCRRGDRVRILATTPAFAGAGAHATVSHTRACHRARPGAAATRWWRGDRGVALPPGRPSENFGNNPMQQSATPEPATGPDPGGDDPAVAL